MIVVFLIQETESDCVLLTSHSPQWLETDKVTSFTRSRPQHSAAIRITSYSAPCLSWLNQSLPSNFKVQVINNTYYRFNDTTHSRVGNFVFQPGKLRKEVTSFYCLSSMSRKLHKEMLFRSVNTSQTVTLTIKSLFYIIM